MAVRSEPVDETVRVLTVATPPLAGLWVAAGQAGRFRTVGLVESMVGALGAMRRYGTPDVILVQSTLIARPAGLALVRRVGPIAPSVLLWGIPSSIGTAIEWLGHGATGYVSSAATVPELVRAVHGAAAGALVVPAEDVVEVIRRLVSGNDRTMPEALF